MHGNSNFERSNRNSTRNERPPRGEQTERKPTQKRGKEFADWERTDSKRNWDSLSIS